MDNKILLKWHIDAGVDEITEETPSDYFAQKQNGVAESNLTAPSIPTDKAINSDITIGSNDKPQITAVSPPLHLAPIEAAKKAREIANNCNTLAELEEAVRSFDGCQLKRTATNTVFSSGNPKSEIMVIGEAPGEQEDIKGIPFCGASGKLLDRMFLSIGLDRDNIYISNTIFWRPPGNRQPNETETSICLPFVEKHISLISPKLLILSGGIATNTLLKKDLSISRLRGKFYDYNNDYTKSSIKTAIIYHPSYLLRQPLHKKQTWHDLLMIKHFLEN